MPQRRAVVCAVLVTIGLLSGCEAADLALATGLTTPRPATVEGLIRARWAAEPKGQADRAVRIARCESGLNPRAANRRSSARGVFQLLATHWRGRFDPYNAAANIDYAYKLYRGSGWRQWVCRG